MRWDHPRACGGTVFTHNHPEELGFSLEDIATPAAYEMAEIRVITRTGLYHMTPADAARWPSELVVLSYDMAPLRKQLEAQALAWRRQAQRRWPGLSNSQLNRLTYDRLMLLLRRRYPDLVYRVVTP